MKKFKIGLSTIVLAVFSTTVIAGAGFLSWYEIGNNITDTFDHPSEYRIWPTVESYSKIFVQGGEDCYQARKDLAKLMKYYRSKCRREYDYPNDRRVCRNLFRMVKNYGISSACD
ncbi:hypothetical protein TI05_07800 [Achromatium sp. WMS3]|nr:hypothetical protein TI05_07800 [Achromatium sp. WMS3]